MVLENFRQVDETEREERFLHCSTKNKYAELKKKKVYLTWKRKCSNNWKKVVKIRVRPRTKNISQRHSTYKPYVKEILSFSCCLVAKLHPSLLWPSGLGPTRLLCPWNSPGKNTAVGCHFLLQGIFPTQGCNLSLLSLLHWQADSSSLNHLGSPDIGMSSHIQPRICAL